MRIAHFIIASPSRTRDMSIGELARACGTSTASLSRFAHMLGYARYKEFLLDLAAAIAHSEKVTLDDFVEGGTPEIIIRRVFEANRESLLQTEKTMDHQELVRVARVVQRARRILFFGIGGSGSVARDAASRFRSLGLIATAAEDPLEQIFLSGSVRAGEVLFGISHTGQTIPVVEAVVTARRRGGRTIAVTNYPQSALAQAAEFRLVTAFREHRINAAVSSSRIAQMCVLDSLYFILGSWGRMAARKLADEAEKRVQAILRLKHTRRKSPEMEAR